jgi:hypothetical protein
MEMLGQQLLDTGQLKQNLTLAEIRDVLWNYLAIDHYERLVLVRGWRIVDFQLWLTAAITDALCP